jgi:hypothetical protein
MREIDEKIVPYLVGIRLIDRQVKGTVTEADWIYVSCQIASFLFLRPTFPRDMARRNTPTEFTLFPQLIAELRWEIWRLALPPPPPTKALYPYKEGCWVVEEIGPQWDGPDPNGENLQARIDTSLLNPLHIEIPLYSVNREARGIVIKYLQQHELVTRLGSIQPQPTFLRFFNSETDTLFLPAADVAAFANEPIDRIHMPDMQNRYVSFPRLALQRLAVTPAGLDVLKKDELETFSVTAGGVDILYVVDPIPTASRFSLRDLENRRAFPLLGLRGASHAQVQWSHSRQEWVASGECQESLMRLQHMVRGLEKYASTTSQYDLDVQLVCLVAP